VTRRDASPEPEIARARPFDDTERRCYEIGRRRWEHGDRDGALRAFARLLETHREFADVHYMVGMLHEQGDDLASAAESLREALRLNPGYAEAMVALSSIYERQGEFARSRALAERVASLSLVSAGALDATTRGKLANLEAGLADAYREAGALHDAIEAYRKALDRCPGYHDIRQRLGVALREAGLPARAIAEFQRVLRANPDYLDAQVQLGVTYYTLGRTAEARDEWNAALERDPSRDDARMYLRLLERSF
jgi:tetratricopeptide (TPR) repeat protein